MRPPAPSAAGAVPDCVIRVEGETSWVLSRAYNLGIGASSFDKVLRTDCDYTLHPDFVAHHALDTSADATLAATSRAAALRNRNASMTGGAAVKLTAPGGGDLPRGYYYSGNFNLARNENEVHLNGAVFIRRADFWAVGGYDERLQAYGYDDEDLYARLSRDAGLTRLNVSYALIHHVRHDNAARSARPFPRARIDYHALLLEGLPAWGGNATTAPAHATYALRRATAGGGCGGRRRRRGRRRQRPSPPGRRHRRSLHTWERLPRSAASLSVAAVRVGDGDGDTAEVDGAAAGGSGPRWENFEPGRLP